jgi:hypothetical protein
MNPRPIHFINSPIEAIYDAPPLFEKKPGCPNRFRWLENEFLVVEIISEWHDYKRKGRMARNMRPENASAAEKRGSWGVGQDYYRIRTNEDRIFDIYYDRAPKSADHRKGEWFLYQELAIDNDN